MSDKRPSPADAYRTQRNASALVIAFWVLAALIIFVTSFVAFLVAPLVLTILFGGGLYLQERVGERRKRQAGTRASAASSAELPSADAPAVTAGGYARYGDRASTEDAG